SSRRRHTRFSRDWSSDVCSSDLIDRLRPSLKLNLSAPGPQLGILVAGASDTTLIVNDPQGNWLCDDDSEFLSDFNPGVFIANPRSEERRVGKGGRSRW